MIDLRIFTAQATVDALAWALLHFLWQGARTLSWGQVPIFSVSLSRCQVCRLTQLSRASKR